MADAYFTAKTFRFLKDLAANNSREWFHANKARYEAEVREPSLRLIGDLGAPLTKISAHYVADSRKQGGSLFRIHRWWNLASGIADAEEDSRFSGRQPSRLDARRAFQSVSRALRILG